MVESAVELALVPNAAEERVFEMFFGLNSALLE